MGPDTEVGVAAAPEQNQSVRTLCRACVECGREYEVNPRHAPTHQFCSPRCRAAHHRRPRQAVLPGESRVERAFADWIGSEDGQTVEAEVVRHALLLRAAGEKRFGMAAIWEVIRYDRAVRLDRATVSPDAWRLNNDFRSLMARRVMQRVPSLAGFFETRGLRGRAA